jgi:hypothetical protein
LSKNKTLTKDNLPKRRVVRDKTCMFCEEVGTCNHLFFECVVATRMWDMILQAIGLNVGGSFENIGPFSLYNKIFLLVNMITSASLWALWKLRNVYVFSEFAVEKHLSDYEEDLSDCYRIG